ncbi:unnamed protein product [Mytilus edulis]|uniref:Uncharacterized protein n=1 Tax=Mytilus edulis TaxID=6550 RepID=A0A8S3RM68_MYTED|nr:unnamed protein product [Mytilus edulis]
MDSGSKSSAETLGTDADSSSSLLNRIAYNNDSCDSCHALSSDLPLNDSTDSHSSDSTDLHSSNSIISRPDKSIYNEALNTEAKWARCKPNEVLILPSKLRPKKKNPKQVNSKIIGLILMKIKTLLSMSIKIQVHLLKFTPHFLSNTRCKSPNPLVQFADKNGICASIKVSCKNCSFWYD